MSFLKISHTDMRRASGAKRYLETLKPAEATLQTTIKWRKCST